MNWQHETPSLLTYPYLPNLWLIKQEELSAAAAATAAAAGRCRRIKISFWVTSSKSSVDKRRFRQKCPASQYVRKEPTKNKFLINFCFELTAWHTFSSDLPLPPKSLVDKSRMIVFRCHCRCRCHYCCLCLPLQDQNLLLRFIKSLVYKRRFQQKCPASQHVRQEPTKIKFLVNFRFELTAWNPFSSDLPLPPKSLVDKRRMIVCCCPCHCRCCWLPPQDHNLLLSYIIQVFSWLKNVWAEVSSQSTRQEGTN